MGQTWTKLLFPDHSIPKTSIPNPCTACGWTPERQNNCRYESHVKLFYGVSDRGVWSLGSNMILKERLDTAPNFEARNIRLLEQETSIPRPTIIEDWVEENQRSFILMRRVRGEPLSRLWKDMSPDQRESIARQTAECLMQLRKLQSPQMHSVEGQPLYSAFLFRNGYGLPHGPLASDDELWAEMDLALKDITEDARLRLRERMPPATPYTFTHGDLTYVNIMVQDGRLTGILDWEAAGYFPVWWEFTCAGIGLSQEDKEWKDLLRRFMPDHTAAREFWMDYYSLSKYPDLDESGRALLGNGVSGSHGQE
ncbi:kinase-like protein [Aspergillus indologenus CBS 114.80]|uniref:Kinase-like protein n=1 Tax=Aspergillus indologenus CBS 114.80 TaxID=1450541 RepID=A0A2V5I472_9EURO|nr:kinase-like protein [Aspergillus indologenus CBS 114.80]